MKVIAIVSGDYGELGSALYFLRGLPGNGRPLLMVPAGRFAEGLQELGFDARPYACLGDILRVVGEVGPDRVLLFSGYLLAIGRHFSLLRLALLIRELRRRGVGIVTSDPFLGMDMGPRSLSFRRIVEVRLRGRLAGLRAALLGSLISLRVYLIYLMLRREWHIYPAPITHAAVRPGHRWMSYFNGPSAREPGGAVQAAARHPLWLFVLSRADHDFQASRYGPAFVDALVLRLAEGRALGKRILVAVPAELVAALGERLPADPGIELRAEGAYGDYMDVLMAAEYAFFWNYYSFSVMHRVLAGLPVFYFDEGHMASILEERARYGIDAFYGGWRPPLLDVWDSFDPPRLEEIAQVTVDNFGRMTERMRAGRSPAELLEAAVAGGTT